MKKCKTLLAAAVACVLALPMFVGCSTPPPSVDEIPVEAYGVYEAALMTALNTYTGDTYTRTDELNELALQYWQEKNRDGVPNVGLGSWDTNGRVYSEFWYHRVILELPESPTESSSWKTIAEEIHGHRSQIQPTREVGFTIQNGLKDSQQTKYLVVTIFYNIDC